MDNFQLTNVYDEIFGNCVKLDNGAVEVLVTVDYGPRVIHFSRVGMENIFYQDKEKKPLGEKLNVFDDVFKLYGGHRLWISPEILPRCYYPDNYPVTYEEVEGGARFTSPVEKDVNIQKSICVTFMQDAPVVKVVHSIKNCGLWDIELSPWSISMMTKGGKTVIPMPNGSTGLLSNRNISLWDYSNMKDERVYWGKEYITLTQNPNIADPFKLGLNSEAGWAAYFVKGQLFFKFFEPAADGIYPDNGCCYETYTNGEMLEMESLGEMSYLSPGDVAFHEEEWELYEEPEVPGNNEKEIKKIIEKYI